jgi:hypothetical protein
MYNLEVAGNHDFFVGDNGWLVHNAYNCGDLTVDAIAERIAAHATPHLRADLARLGISSDKFGTHIADTIKRIESSSFRDMNMTTVGNKTYFWDDATKSIIIINPGAKDLGTVFKPDSGYKYFKEIVEGKRK